MAAKKAVELAVKSPSPPLQLEILFDKLNSSIPLLEYNEFW